MARKELRENARKAAEKRVLTLLGGVNPEEAERFRTDGKLMLGAAFYAGATKDDLLVMWFKRKDVTDAEKAHVLPCVGCERILHYSTLPGTHVFKAKNICRGCGAAWCNTCRKRLKAVRKLWVLKIEICECCG